MTFPGIARPVRRHRAVDEVNRLRHRLAKAHAGLGLMRHQLDEAQAARDTANAKVSQLRDELARAVEATRQNQQAVSSLTAHPAVTETQPIPVPTAPPVAARQPEPHPGEAVMADEWNAYEQLRHAVLTEVPPELGNGSWCLKDAWQAMRGARDFKPQYSFVIAQLDRLVAKGVLRLEAGVYVPVTPVHRPAL